jgi:flagellar biosynthesis protein FlhF
MRDALILVKQEQGPDAVILGNKKVPGGVEILSAIDYDEAAIASMAQAAPGQGQARHSERELATPANDVASDAWVGSILNDGRKEPTLGPVAAGGSRPRVCQPPLAAALEAAPVSQVQPAPAPRPASRPQAGSAAPQAGARQRVARPAAKKPVAKKAAVKKPIKPLSASSARPRYDQRRRSR